MLVKFRKLIWVMELHDMGSVRQWFNNPYKERQFVNVCVNVYCLYAGVVIVYSAFWNRMFTNVIRRHRCCTLPRARWSQYDTVPACVEFFFWSFESHTSLASPDGSFCLPFEIKIFLSIPYSSCSLHVSLIWLYLTITLIIMSKYKIWNFTL
jgi:hypothetical protein